MKFFHVTQSVAPHDLVTINSDQIVSMASRGDLGSRYVRISFVKGELLVKESIPQLLDLIEK